MIDTSDPSADPTNGGTPSPNDTPIPDVDGEPEGTPQTGGRVESAGRGIARLMRHDRARFLRCVARVGDSDRRAMAGALESYLTAQPHLFTGAPSADRILAFWAGEGDALAS